MLSIINEFYDQHGQYTQQNQHNLSPEIKNKQSHNQMARSQRRRIGRPSKAVDMRQMRGQFKEDPKFGRWKGVKHMTNRFNNWKNQKVLSRLTNRKRKTNFPKMGPGDRRNIAWDALDGVF